MSTEQTQPSEIPFPLAIRQLVELHNVRLREYQQASLKDIQDASIEIMNLLGLFPSDGWRMDIEALKYVRIDTQTTNESA